MSRIVSFPRQNPRSGIILLLLLTWLSANGQTQQASQDEAAEVPNTGAITGKVVNESGQPLTNATVLIRAVGSGTQGQVVTTDREGSFQLSGLERLAYLVSANVPAYATPPRDPDNTETSYYRVGDSVRLVLVKGGVITGSVRTSEDEPVVGVRVRAQMIRDGNGQPSRYGALFRDRPTDDRGIYRIYGLPPGSYLVLAGGAGFGGYGVNAYGTDAPTYAPASARDTAAEINVRVGEETANVDIRYRGEAGHMVSGIAVRLQTAESASFSVILSSTLDGGSQWSNTSFLPPSSPGFVFYGVADGDYYVTAQSYFQSGELSVSEPKQIKVTGADITGIELTAKPLGSITGRIIQEDSKALECKGKRRPLLTESLVSAWHNEKAKAKDQPQFIWSLGAPAAPDKEGNFTLRNLAAGEYHFIPRFSAKYWYLQSISLPPSSTVSTRSTEPNRSVDAARHWTTLKSGDRLSGLEIKLAAGAGSLRGQIRIDEGKEIPSRLYVYLVPAESEESEDVLRFFAAPVSSDGSIALNNLPPGRYWILAQPAIEGPTSPLAKIRLPDETETRARLRRDAEGGKTEIEFKPCQNVMGYQLAFKPSATLPAKKSQN